MAVLRQRYPRYEADVGATLFSAARRELETRVRNIYAAATPATAPRPRILAMSAAAPVAYAPVAPETAPSDMAAWRAWLARNAVEAVYAPDPRSIAADLRAAARSVDVDVVSTPAELAMVAPVSGVP